MDVSKMSPVTSAMSMSFFPQYSDNENAGGGFSPVGLDISF